jgi:thiosulfate dehydrogenase [quinone] large subunit
MSAVHVPVRTRTDVGAMSLAVLRIATGLLFLWAFFDKAFGLGYATQAKNAWFSGGSPTKGFLGRVNVGPFESMFRDWAGDWWADTLFMVGLLAIGVALVLGIGLRVAAVTGTLMMLLMWAAEWPLAQHNSAGEATMSTNPVIDYHIVYALVLIVVATTASGAIWSLTQWWSALPFVRANPWLK